MKRISEITFIVIVTAALFVFAGATLLSETPEELYYEQRHVTPYPTMIKTTLWNGDYFTDLEAALVDHTPHREQLLKIHTAIQLTAGRVTVNDVIVNAQAVLDYYEHVYWRVSYLIKEAKEVGYFYKDLQESIEDYGGYFIYLGFPYQSTYYSDLYPDYMESRSWHTSAIRLEFQTAMDQMEVPFLDMYEAYRRMGLPVAYYLATDHHCSMEGAFVAYQLLMDRVVQDTGFDLPVLTEEDVEWVTLGNPFLGSGNRKLYGLWENDDQMKYLRLKEEISFRRTDNGEEVAARVYHLPEDDTSYTTYSLYMGGDVAETVLETNRPELPNVLIYGDSFTNILETVIWTGFNETRSLDFRYYTEKTLQEYIEEFKPDVVICIRDETAYLTRGGNGATLD